ncbi:CBM96 family carbohydrate-binding protein [Flavicella marina]|uniref:CBM96 family carbohydrate-binding protein n=1 Tax=Flavicella marina TaxID=1475951 RepID=UPI00126483E4|nr:DNRLRE domain-containing protein [Flavicella marina]
MKKLIALLVIVSMTYTVEAQTQKLKVVEDAFIQGGNTSDTAFGESSPKNLRIFKSNSDTKYSRITYLKFETPKKLKSVDKVTLHIPLKVYKNEDQPDATFNLEIYAVENDKWRELSITWSDALELGELVGSMEVPQSLDGKNQKLAIELDAKIVSDLFNGKKDRKITLALVNSNFNKISAMAPSKEQSTKVASYLIIE